MDQLRFEWAEPIQTAEPRTVDLDHETADAAVALMARALIAVVRTTQEAADER